MFIDWRGRGGEGGGEEVIYGVGNTALKAVKRKSYFGYRIFSVIILVRISLHPTCGKKPLTLAACRVVADHVNSPPF